MSEQVSPGGVFAVARTIWEDPDFAPEPFTEREAWMWLVGAATWRAIRVKGAGPIPVNLVRSELSFSVRFLAEKWRWSKSRVDRFISTLEKRDMIRDTSRDGAKIYSIKNYNRFQIIGLPNGTASGTDDGTRAGQERDRSGTKKKQVKQVKQVNLMSDDPQKGFDEWYGAYPRKEGRAKAYPTYVRALEKAPHDRLMAGVRAYSRAVAGHERQFIKLPTTWLNGEHWNDYPATPANGAATETGGDRLFRAQVRAFQNTGVWLSIDGPRPGEPGCLVPAAILKEHGIG